MESKNFNCIPKKATRLIKRILKPIKKLIKSFKSPPTSSSLFPIPIPLLSPLPYFSFPSSPRLSPLLLLLHHNFSFSHPFSYFPPLPPFSFPLMPLLTFSHFLLAFPQFLTPSALLCFPLLAHHTLPYSHIPHFVQPVPLIPPLPLSLFPLLIISIPLLPISTPSPSHTFILFQSLPSVPVCSSPSLSPDSLSLTYSQFLPLSSFLYCSHFPSQEKSTTDGRTPNRKGFLAVATKP